MKNTVKLAIVSLSVTLIYAVFFIIPVHAQTGTGILIQQPNTTLTSGYCNLAAHQCQYVYDIGSGLTGSTTQIAIAGIFYSQTAQSGGFRVDIVSGSNTCTYDGNIPANATTTGVIILTHLFQSVGTYGCVLQSTLSYTLTISINNGNNTGTAQFYGVLSSVPPFIFVSSTDDTNLKNTVNPPYVVVYAQFQSIPSQFSSGVSTSTIQTFCNSSYSTSTGLFSDLSIAVSYGLCTAGTFLFVPQSSTLQDFYQLSSTTASKIPFSYFYALIPLYDNLFASSSNFVDYTFDISSTSVKNTSFGTIIPSVNFFSTSTISTYISPSTLSVLRTLMAAIVWLAFALYAFRRAQGLLKRS